MKAWQIIWTAVALALFLRLVATHSLAPIRQTERTPRSTKADDTTRRAEESTECSVANWGLSPPSRTASRVLPVQFVENRGQISGLARFITSWPHQRAWIAPTGLTLEIPCCDGHAVTAHGECTTEDKSARDAIAVHGAHVALIFEDAAAGATVESVGSTSTNFSYFLGNDPKRWIKGIPGSQRLRWRGLYPGITVDLHGDAGHLEYDVSVEPSAELSDLVVRVEGAEGISLLPDGELRIETAGGPIYQAQPPTWEVTPDGRREPVACAYAILDDQHFSFITQRRDPAQVLVIDPELEFGTFLGGSSADECFGVAIDAEGNACLGGSTSSGTDFPVTLGAFDTTIGAFKPDGFVAKLSPGGDSLIYATYLGGNLSDESVSDIAVAQSGAVVVSGSTGSADFPTTPGAFDTSLDGETDSFITRLTSNGSDLEYSTLLGGDDDDAIRGLAVDSQERVCFAGLTRSPDFPVTPNAFQPVINPVFLDGMLGRLSADGAALDYSTFMPGTHNAQCLALDLEGRACVGGGADSFYVTTPGALHTPFGEQFVYKFDFEVGSLVYAAKFGGSEVEFLERLAVDARGAVYACGNSDSFNFPTTPGAYDTTQNGFSDAFVAKLSPDGDVLEWASLFGGSSSETKVVATIDTQDRVYVAGRTTSANLPATPDAFDMQLRGADGGFLAQLSADGSQLLYCTYFGGTSFWGIPRGVAINAMSEAYVVGYTHATDFPTTPGTVMPGYGPGTNSNNGFVLKFAFGPWTNVGHALAGVGGATPLLLGDGSLAASSPGSIALTKAKPSAPAHLIVGLLALSAPFKGGTMVPQPQLLIPLSTDSSGSRALSWLHWPAALPSGTELLLQYWIVDPAGPAGFSASNALQASVP